MPITIRVQTTDGRARYVRAIDDAHAKRIAALLLRASDRGLLRYRIDRVTWPIFT